MTHDETTLSRLAHLRAVINSDGLEREANLPVNTIGKHWLWLDGNQHGAKCPAKWLPAIKEVLDRGIERNGGFHPSLNDVRYMSDDEDISFPPQPDRIQ